MIPADILTAIVVIGQAIVRKRARLVKPWPGP